jgi:hypothetical protein
MGLQNSVGASLDYSATLPATHDAAGFAALTYLKVGKLSTLPELDGTRDIATFDNLETGEEEKFADMIRAGNSTFNVGLDKSDVGQSAIESAYAAGTKGSMKITLKDGTKYYRTCILTSYKGTGLAAGSVVMAEIGVEFEKTTVKV